LWPPTVRYYSIADRPVLTEGIVMQVFNMDATAAMDRVRKAHEPTWILPGVQEQLVLFKLCNFVPMPGVGCYDSWRNKMLNCGMK
jgi:hypothetical protein